MFTVIYFAIASSFFFLSLPFAISIAATVQISSQLAKNKYQKARCTALLCILEGSILMAVAAGIIYVLKSHVGYFFTSNPDVVARIESLASYSAGFQAAYGVYGSTQGVLRATAHQFDILGYVVKLLTYVMHCKCLLLFCLLVCNSICFTFSLAF
jgi:multidrug resistance protein, MATE family